MKIKANSIDIVDMEDGSYRARMGGDTVVITSTRYRFKVDKNTGCLSYAGWATVKDKRAKFESNGYY